MFIYKNVNPKNKNTGDCSTRALALAMDISWQDALLAQYKEGAKQCLDTTDNKVMNAILTANGFEKLNVAPKKGEKRYTPKTLAAEYFSGSLVVGVAHHYTCIKDGDVYDTVNCFNKAVYSAWIKY